MTFLRIDGFGAAGVNITQKERCRNTISVSFGFLPEPTLAPLVPRMQPDSHTFFPEFIRNGLELDNAPLQLNALALTATRDGSNREKRESQTI
jgi:hypothetical protein